MVYSAYAVFWTRDLVLFRCHFGHAIYIWYCCRYYGCGTPDNLFMCIICTFHQRPLSGTLINTIRYLDDSIFILQQQIITLRLTQQRSGTEWSSAVSLKSKICKDTAPRPTLAPYCHNGYTDHAREPLHLRCAPATRRRSASIALRAIRHPAQHRENGAKKSTPPTRRPLRGKSEKGRMKNREENQKTVWQPRYKDGA